MEICSKLTGWKQNEGFLMFYTDSAEIRVCFLTDEICRIRVSFDRAFREASYVLAATAWKDDLDDLFEGERIRLSPAPFTVKEYPSCLDFSTGRLRLRVERDPLCLTLFDEQGSELYRSLEGSPFVRDSNRRITHYSRMKEDDCFYGFGEKGGELNKNQAFLRQQAADAFGYDPRLTDPLYKHIPFYIRLDRESKKAVGLFYHNFYASVFNMGAEISNYRPRYSYWQADGGDIDLFLLGGGSIKRILDHYTFLTGRPALLPKRAFGYQCSSMYYAELEKDSDDAILSFLDTVEEEGFPYDGFHLSSGYTAKEGKRYVFTWNHDRFKDPKAYFAAMNQRGAQNVPNVKPGVLLSHPLMEDFEKEGVFLRNSTAPDRSAQGSWWGGPGVFWDFTNPAARRVWKQCLKDSLLSLGTASLWNDNCEYDGLLDSDALACYDGAGGTIGELRPLMSNLMCRTGAQAVLELDPDARPYMVCRSGAAGIQRVAQTWCGDNRTGWDTLRYNIPMILGMGLSGQPNDGADIGGFAGPSPEEELFVRWVQNGIFQPRFSIHSANDDNTVTEPWMYHKTTGLIREAILLRYRFTPYLYSLAYEAAQNGAPIMRALVYEFQEDPAVWDESFTFLFGRDLLVANVLEPGAKTRSVTLPSGCRWYDWNDSFRCYEGGQTVEVPVSLETIPMFLREGAVLPMADNQLMHMEKDAVTALHLLLAPGREERTVTLYDDDGVSNAFQKGVFRKTVIRMSGEKEVKVHFSSQGSYIDPVKTVTVEMICRGRSPRTVALGGTVLERILNRRHFEAAESGWYYSHSKKCVLIRYPNPWKEITLSVSFESNDLIGMKIPCCPGDSPGNINVDGSQK